MTGQGFEDVPLPGTDQPREEAVLGLPRKAAQGTPSAPAKSAPQRGGRKPAAKRASSRPRKPVQHPPGRWAVAYRHGKTVQVWAWIEDVPERTSSAAVSEALAQWPRWPGWQRRISPGGHVDVMPAAKLPAGVWPVPAVSLTWGELTPEDRKVSLNVSAALWADLRAEAAADEQSLGAWCVDALTAAVEARKAARA